MSDDKNKKGPQDSARVNVNESYEVQYWCNKFNCSEDELRVAVKSVGVMAADVEIALKKK